MLTYVYKCCIIGEKGRRTVDMDIRMVILVLFVYRQALGLFFALGAAYLTMEKEKGSAAGPERPETLPKNL